MNFIFKSVTILVKAADGSPIVTTVVIFFFYLFFNLIEANIEELVFGKPFVHWLDPIFVGLTIIYSMLAVYECAMFKYGNRR